MIKVKSLGKKSYFLQTSLDGGIVVLALFSITASASFIAAVASFTQS